MAKRKTVKGLSEEVGKLEAELEKNQWCNNWGHRIKEWPMDFSRHEEIAVSFYMNRKSNGSYSQPDKAKAYIMLYRKCRRSGVADSKTFPIKGRLWRRIRKYLGQSKLEGSDG